MHTLKIPCDPGQVSDGYHTFEELYAHRHALFLAFMKACPETAWISIKHDDGSEWDGWFIAGMALPAGDISYHLPIRYYSMAVETGAVVLERGKKWDGHTAGNVVMRLHAFAHQPPRPSPVERLRRTLAVLVGADSKDELEQMAAILRAAPVPAADKTAMLDAIQVLLETGD